LLHNTEKFELGTYIEYGLTNWLTLVASPSYDRIHNPPPGQSYNGPGESEIAARVGLYRSDTSVLSFQAGLRSPGGSFADSLGPFEVRRAASLDFRGLAGRNVVVAEMEGFVEAQAGYRFYAAGQPGEWRIDLTMGLRPWPRLLMMLQSTTRRLSTVPSNSAMSPGPSCNQAWFMTSRQTGRCRSEAS